MQLVYQVYKQEEENQELKLQSTDINLEKVQINLDNLLDQKSLSRQARQAERYENLSKAINFMNLSLFYQSGKA